MLCDVQIAAVIPRAIGRRAIGRRAFEARNHSSYWPQREEHLLSSDGLRKTNKSV
jgi:hypothetical protein